MGLYIHFQEPLLGENVGLSDSKSLTGVGYNGLYADFLQNSTTGRRISLEVRAYNDGVAFRYVLPKQFPLLDLLIEDEVTEFNFAAAADRPARANLPYQRGGAGRWVDRDLRRPRARIPADVASAQRSESTDHPSAR